MAEYIDVTPTWEGLLVALLAIYESGERKYALAELTRMAQAADEAVRTRKEQQRDN